MKILSYQPFSLFGTGGGSRILRRLYQGNECDVYSIGLSANAATKETGNIKEKIVSLMPLHYSWMRWRIRDCVTWVRENLFKHISIILIKNTAKQVKYDVLHVVDHSSLSTILCTERFLLKKLLWVSFHDHFSTTNGSLSNTGILWEKADRRLVISEELGNEYNHLFGKKDFEIITDGVLDSEISTPIAPQKSLITIYFAGLLHIEYLQLFRILADALDILAKEGVKIKLILRGTQNINFLNKRFFEIEYRPFSINNKELKEELDSASILYLPIKFTIPDFYLYSLSTKMVGYLGGAGSILYHGPGDSAACNLLRQTGSAICCTSLNVNEFIDSFRILLSNNEVSINAKKLAHKNFSLVKIQNKFWQVSYQ